MKLSMTTLDEWLWNYGRAWVEQDPDALVALFAADSSYQRTPFEEPMRGHEAIRNYWIEGAQRSQSDISFRHQCLSTEGGVGIAHWQATFTRTSTGARVSVDGVLTVQFDQDGRCIEFREWWHRDESANPGR